MRLLTRALAALSILAGAICAAPAMASPPALYVYTTTSPTWATQQGYLTRWRNFIGGKEAGWLAFNDWTAGATKRALQRAVGRWRRQVARG